MQEIRPDTVAPQPMTKRNCTTACLLSELCHAFNTLPFFLLVRKKCAETCIRVWQFFPLCDRWAYISLYKLIPLNGGSVHAFIHRACIQDTTSLSVGSEKVCSGLLAYLFGNCFLCVIDGQISLCKLIPLNGTSVHVFIFSTCTVGEIKTSSIVDIMYY